MHQAIASEVMSTADSKGLRRMSQNIYNLSNNELYEEIERRMGLRRSTGSPDWYLKNLTRTIIHNWNDDRLFMLWAHVREHTWKATLSGILRHQQEFKGVEKRYQNDPRRRYVR